MPYEAHKRVDFITSWDGSEPPLTDAEKREAFDAYQDLTASFISLWMTRAADSQDPLWSGTKFRENIFPRTEPQAHLIRWFDDRSVMNLTMQTTGRVHRSPRYNYPHVHYPELSIQLQGPAGVRWGQYNYELAQIPDARGPQLVRVDHRRNPLIEIFGHQELLTLDVESAEKYQRLFTNMKNESQNLALEISMGLNKLPVRAGEILRIVEMIDRIDAETYVVPDTNA